MCFQCDVSHMQLLSNILRCKRRFRCSYSCGNVFSTTLRRYYEILFARKPRILIGCVDGRTQPFRTADWLIQHNVTDLPCNTIVNEGRDSWQHNKHNIIHCYFYPTLSRYVYTTTITNSPRRPLQQLFFAHAHIRLCVCLRFMSVVCFQVWIVIINWLPY